MLIGWLKSRVLSYVGRHRYWKRDFHGAYKYFEGIIAGRPWALGANVWLASCDIALKRYGDAVVPLEKAKPDLATAHGYLGVALFHQGLHRGALEEFTRALRINPHLKPNDSWMEWLGRAYYEVGRWQEAINSFEEAIRVQPSTY